MKRLAKSAALLICALTLAQSTGCVMFGRQVMSSDWEPDDAQFALEITVPIGRSQQHVAASSELPRSLHDDQLAQLSSDGWLPDARSYALRSLE